MDTHPVRFVDRSRIVEDWRCPRARYLHYEHGGRGLSPTTTSIELWMGTTIHAALHSIALGTPIEEVAAAAQAQMYDSLAMVAPGEVPSPDQLTYASEQAALVEGLVRGFHRHVWPRLMQPGWKIIAIEQEVQVTLADGIVFMAKPDLVIEDDQGEWTYVEYKSTSSKRQQWMDSWGTAVQLHSSIRAVEATLGQAPSRVIIQGLYKSYQAYGRQQSPLCYIYRRSGNPPFTQDQIEYGYKAGFARTPTWQLPGGVAGVVAGMPEEVLTDLFPQAPPIFVKDHLVDAFFRQVTAREKLIAEAMQDGEIDDPRLGVDVVFPQHFDQCVPAFGHPCAFRRICHSHVEDPLTQGYSWREFHHTPEADQHAAEVDG